MQNEHIHMMRHSCAHLLATAVQQLYPNARFGVGPSIEHGCYYDIALDQPLTPKDLKEIEKTMKKLKGKAIPFERMDMRLQEAKDLFKQLGQTLKLDLLKDLEERGTTEVGEDVAFDPKAPEYVSVYKTNEFVDLCRGPHVESSDQIGAFKVATVSGAYWRGDEHNEQMQRVYVLCFPDEETLQAHLHMVEEAKKRDHRKLMKDLDLVAFSDLIGPGLPLWTTRGTIVREALDGFVWSLRKQYGYERVTVPHITKKELYETSGHWQKFKDDLFKIVTREGHEFAMKPMNCPHHTQIYASKQRSYRDLPQRYAETTMVYRDEQTGELSGLSRVRSITQDDAHVFCREADVRAEAFKIWNIIEAFYGQFGFELRLRLSAHDPKNMGAYLGEESVWQAQVDVLKTWMDERGIETYEYAVGEAAFYGPKVDFIAKDALGREWQVATIQVDRHMPSRFGLTCVNEQGAEEPIVMVHAAIMGSIERFCAVLLEHTGGVLPMWVAPVSIRLVPVNDTCNNYAIELVEKLRAMGVRADVDTTSEGVGKKVRKSAQEKVPWTVVIGEKELQGGDIVVNVFAQEKDVVFKPEAFFQEAQTRCALPHVNLPDVK